MTVKQITVVQLQQRLQHGEQLVLLDVREDNEYQHAHIDGSIHIPLNQIPERIPELDSQHTIVVICHHGMRSQQAAQYMLQSGFSDISNVVGGIDAWSCECDSSVTRY